MEFDLNTDLLELLPPLYREIEDYQQICNAEKVQFDRLANSILAVYQNFFVQTADADSIQKWEQVFHIRAKPSTETLEFRRLRILSRLSTRPPYTLAFLYQQLDELLGSGNWTCQVDYPNYALAIGADTESKPHRDEMIRLIHQIKPAHISFRSFLFHVAEKMPVYVAAAPCSISISMTARLPRITMKGVTP